MKRATCLLLAIALLIGAVATTGCVVSRSDYETLQSDYEALQAEKTNLLANYEALQSDYEALQTRLATSSFTIVKMNGKELTIGTPTLAGDAYRCIVSVKNTGSEQIALAELKAVYYDATGTLIREQTLPLITDLATNEIQTSLGFTMGAYESLRIEVSRLE